MGAIPNVYMATGDLLSELQETLTEEDGTVPDVTGLTVTLEMKERVTGTTKSLAATVVDGTNGIVKRTWVSPDTDTPGYWDYRWLVQFAGGPKSYPNRGSRLLLISDLGPG